MAQWQKAQIKRENGETVDAQTPLIVSASRSTDIPAFYADWFFYRLEKGYSAWTNPFNGVKSYVSYEKTRFIVFWSKNPRPLLPYLHILKERNIKCYIQYTLNDYEQEKLEKVPSLANRIETFKLLVEQLGKGAVIWRFDPLMLTDDISVDDLLEKVRNIGDQLKDYTEKLVFSYADIAMYKKVKHNLEVNGIPYHEWETEQMEVFAEKLSAMNRELGWNYQLATCGEKIDRRTIQRDVVTTQKANEGLISTTQKKGLATQKSKTTTQKPLNATQKKILAYLHNYPKATRKETADALGDITEDGVKFNIGLMQQYGALKRIGGRKNGEWEVNSDYLSE